MTSLEIMRKGRDGFMQNKEVEKELPGTIVAWYPFKRQSDLLLVTDGSEERDALLGTFSRLGLNVLKCREDEAYGCGGRFDYVMLVGALEKSRRPHALLKKVKSLLAADGRLLAAADNRLAIRYFCGDKDEYTGHVLDGVENYARVRPERWKKMRGRAYSKAELQELFLEAGFKWQKFYSVVPAISRPQVILADTYVPNEALDVRVFPQYHCPQTVFLEEERLYDDLLKNGMFHSMANGFLIECSMDGRLTDADQITVSGDRGRENALATIIRSGKDICKRALYEEGRKRISELLDNTKYLVKQGIPMIEAKVSGDSFMMPYVEGEIATLYFRKTLRKDKDEFVAELERFRDIILCSSETVSYDEINWRQFEPGWEKRKSDDPNMDKWERLAFGSLEERADIGIILKRGYIDLVSLNCFYTEAGFLFFDQEFYVENLPANVIFIRTIDLIYEGCADLEVILPREELLRYFRLWEHQSTWRKFTEVFIRKLRSEDALAGYHKLCRRDWRATEFNRHRMDYTQEEYGRLFTNIFKDVEDKAIYLFGSGRFAEQFISQFSAYYEIAGIVDNDENKWGKTFSAMEDVRNARDLKISSPKKLQEIKMPFRVFICIKYFDTVMEQLKDMGIKDFVVYNPNLEYDRPLKQACVEEKKEPKKYHIGYVAGVFDLFHVGHLNLFRRAKGLCDYLIVGVVSDEQVVRYKKTRPYIPFEERLEIVEACRYVDEAVRIPSERPGTEEAYRRYHFDVQFSGSDYENDPDWLAEKIYLQQRGADLVFFPYTERISSSKIKARIQGGESEGVESDGLFGY